MMDSIALIVILSFIIPFLSVKLFGGLIPSVAFEIAAGFIVGKSGLNIIDTNSEILSFLSLFGLAFLMFLGGLESEFSLKRGFDRKTLLKAPISIATMTFVLTFIFSLMFSIFLNKLFNCSKSVLYLTLVFSTTSVAIVLPTLKAKENLKLSYKQTLLYSAFIADFITLIAITIFSAYIEKNRLSKDMLFVFVIFAIAIFLSKTMKKIPENSKLVHTLKQLKYKPHIQIGIRGSFAILLLFMFLAEKLGVEVILGSFIAGLIISTMNFKEKKTLIMKLEAIGYGFFIPIFFLYQGSISTIPLDSSSLKLVFVIVLGGLSIKVASSLPLLIRFSLRDTLAGGVLLSGRLSLIIAAGMIGLKLGIINSKVYSSIIILAAITCILSPVLFNLIEGSRTKNRLI